MEELRVGDNDTLAAHVAVTLKADLLVLLTDVDGLMTKHPRDGQGKLIPVVSQITPKIEALAHGAPGSDGGTGGMRTKVQAAKIATCHGVRMIIANGQKEGILKSVIRQIPVGTLFLSRQS